VESFIESTESQLYIMDGKINFPGWAGHVARMRVNRKAYRILVGKPEEKRQLGRPTRRCANNIKIDLREIR
jgi:hypothetical protein